MSSLKISQSAIDLIVAEEVSSKAYYEKNYKNPEWPGERSGITVGIGYDLGYASKAKIINDFGGKVPSDMLTVMQSCAGISGSSAKALLPSVKKKIVIPWDVAMDVFMNRDIPQWIATVDKALPNCELLNPTQLGVLVSLAYNRGAGGFNSAGDRYSEMRAIKAAMAAKNFSAIPGLLRKMARLWPNSKGLQGRRNREATLFEKSTKNNYVSEPIVSVSKNTTISPSVIDSSRPDESARTPVPASSTLQNVTTATAAIAPTVEASKSYSEGLISPITLTLFIVFGLVVAGGIWFAWYRNRNPK